VKKRKKKNFFYKFGRAVAKARLSFREGLYSIHVRQRYLHDVTYNKVGWYKNWTDKKYSASVHRAVFVAFIVSFVFFQGLQYLFPYFNLWNPNQALAGANQVTWTSQADFENNAVTTGANTVMSSEIASGDNLTLNQSPLYLDGVTKVSGIAYTAYALREDGSLLGWGRNNAGQLGDGTTSDKLTPTLISLNNVNSIHSGGDFAIALDSNGDLWAWGNNAYGQLGLGDTTQRTTPTKISSLTNVVKVAAGNAHVLAIKNDGTLWAWGHNNAGKLGLGDYTNRNTPVQVGADNTWSDVVAGISHSLGVKTDGTLWSWGDNAFGQLGLGDTTSRNTPVQVGIGTNWSKIAASNHALALKTDGTLWSWGYNASGQLGFGTTTNGLLPAQVGSDTDWLQISAGAQHSMAVKSNNELWSWGEGGYGRLGNNSTSDVKNPTKIGTDSDWLNVCGAWAHSYGLKTDGTLWSWGLNEYGNLGDGFTIEIRVPHKVVEKTSTVNFTDQGQKLQKSGGGYYSIILKSDKTLWSFGRNQYGELGDGTNLDRSSPIIIPGINNVTEVSSGYAHNVALKSDGTLWAWGSNSYGQLGLGDKINRLTPTQIGADSDWAKVFTGSEMSLALKSDGTLWAWGYNGHGQLGLGDTTERLTPTQVGSDNNWSSASALYQFTIALKSDGTFWSWGYNSYGQLGDGGKSNKNAPNNVTSAVMVTQGYVSRATVTNFQIDATTNATWSTIFWNGTEPENSNIKFRTRGADTEANLASAEWSSYLDNSGDAITSGTSRWLEIELTLESLNNEVAPILDDFTITYDTLDPPDNADIILSKVDGTNLKNSAGETVTGGTPGAFTNSTTLRVTANSLSCTSCATLPTNLRPEVEVKEIGVAFDGTETYVATVGDSYVDIPNLSETGQYHLRLRAVDDQGRVSGWTSYGANDEAEADVSVDQVAPTGAVTINSNEVYTSSATVTLDTSTANDTGGSGLSQMRFSNDGVTFSDWETYQTSKSWTLSAGDGEKTVYGQYRDNAGNITGKVFTSQVDWEAATLNDLTAIKYPGSLTRVDQQLGYQDAEITADYIPVSDTYDIRGRINGDTYYRLYAPYNAGNEMWYLYLYKVINGSETLLGSTEVYWYDLPGENCKLSIIGDSLKVYMGTGTNWSEQISVTDSAIASAGSWSVVTGTELSFNPLSDPVGTPDHGTLGDTGTALIVDSGIGESRFWQSLNWNSSTLNDINDAIKFQISTNGADWLGPDGQVGNWDTNFFGQVYGALKVENITNIGSSRYLYIKVRINSTQTEAPRLDDLAVNFAFTDTIILDSSIPSITDYSVESSTGDTVYAKADSRIITAKGIFADNGSTSDLKVQFSEDGTNWGKYSGSGTTNIKSTDWTNYLTVTPHDTNLQALTNAWYLEGTDGEKTIYIRAQDAAGNELLYWAQSSTSGFDNGEKENISVESDGLKLSGVQSDYYSDPSTDGYLESITYPSGNCGSAHTAEDYANVYNDYGVDEGYFKFNIAELPDVDNINSVSLRFTKKSSGLIYIKRIADYGSIDCSDRSLADLESLGSFSSSPGNTYRVDVTNSVKSLKNLGETYLAIRLQASSGTLSSVYTSNHVTPSVRPALEVVFNNPYSATGVFLSPSHDYGKEVNAGNISWLADIPAETGTDALRFQVAANNDNATWNFVGPDGTNSTYFTTSGSLLPSLLSGNRYFKYKAYLKTANNQFTPIVQEVALGSKNPSDTLILDTSAPTAITGLIASQNDPENIVVSWSEYADGASAVTNYQVNRVKKIDYQANGLTATGDWSGVSSYAVIDCGTETSFTESSNGILTAGCSLTSGNVITESVAYYYRVRAKDAAYSDAWGEWSMEAVLGYTVDGSAPSVPTQITATACLSDGTNCSDIANAGYEVKLTWNASTDTGLGVSGYKIYRKHSSYSANEEDFTLVGYVDINPPKNQILPPENITITYYDNDTNNEATFSDSTLGTVKEAATERLNDYTSYYYRITSIDENKNETNVIAAEPGNPLNLAYNSVTVTTADVTLPTTPTDLVPTAVGVDSLGNDPETQGVEVVWSASTDSRTADRLPEGLGSGISGYRLYRASGDATQPQEAFTLIYADSLASYTDEGLSEDTYYYYKVAAVDNQGNESSFSDYVQVKSKNAQVPTTPSNVTITAKTGDPNLDPEVGYKVSISFTGSKIKVAENRIDTYKVFRSTVNYGDDSSWTALAPVYEFTDLAIAGDVQDGTRSFTDTVENDATTYYYKIQAIGYNTSNQEVVYSGLSSISVGTLHRGWDTTPDATAPESPTEVTVKDIHGNDTLYRNIVTWQKIADPSRNGTNDFSHYEVWRYETALGVAMAQKISTDSNYTDIGYNYFVDGIPVAAANKDYSYYVVALDNARTEFKYANGSVINSYSNNSGNIGTASINPSIASPTVSSIGHTSVGVSSATITWQTNQNCDSLVEYKIKDTDTVLAAGKDRTAPVTSHIVNLVGLQKGKTYQYRVISRNSLGNIDPTAATNWNEFTTKDFAISEIKVESTTTTTTVSWKTNIAGDSSVEFKPESSTEASQTAGDPNLTTTHKVVIKGLKPATTYTYKIRSVSADKYITDTQFATFNTKPFDTSQFTISPSASNIAEENITATSAKIVWNTMIETTTWVDYGTDSENYSQSAGEDVLNTVHVVELKNLTPGTTYYYRVRGNDANDVEYTSKEYIFTAVLEPEISGLKVSVKSPYLATISFNTNVDTEASITYGVNGALDFKAGTSEYKRNHTIELQNLTDDTSYSYYIEVKDKLDNSKKSAVSNFATPIDTTGPAVSDVKVDILPMGESDETAQVIISWTTDKPATTQVEYDEGVVGGKYANATVLDESLNNSHTVIIKDLNPSTTYRFRIVTKDKRDNITKTQDFTFVTPQKEKSILQLIIKSLEETFSWVSNVGSFFKGLGKKVQ